MADETIGYTIRVDGFAAIKADAAAAFSEIEKGADGAEQKLRRLTSAGSGGAPFNAVDAALARIAGRGPSNPPTIEAGGGAAPTGPLQYLLPQVSGGAESFGKYSVAAQTAAQGTEGFTAAAGRAGTVATGMGAAVVASGAAVLNWMKDGTAAAVAQEAALRRLDGQLKVMGAGAQVTGREIGALAEEIEALTNIDSTKVVDMASALLERNVKPEQLAAATRLTADLTGATGSAEKAVQLLTGALAGNYQGLNRYGAKLSEASSQADVFAELQRVATQGAAQNAAQMDTTAGAWGRLTNRIEDLGKAGGRGFVSTFKVNEALNFLADLLPGTAAKTVSAAEAMAELAAAADDVDAAVDGAAVRLGEFEEAAGRAATLAKDQQDNMARARRAQRVADNAGERALAEEHAAALLAIARKESDGSFSAEQAQSLRQQIERTRAVDEAAAASAAAAAEVERLKKAEAELAAEVQRVGEAFNKLSGESQMAAGKDLREARAALREVEQAREDAEEGVEKARSKQQIAEAAREEARASAAAEKRRQAERDAADAEREADRARDRADKERKRAVDLLADAVEQERKAREQIDAAEREHPKDKNGRKKIISRDAEESARAERERQAPDRTSGTAAAERNAAKAAELKAAAEDARKTGEEIAQMTDVFRGLLGGAFSSVADALKKMQEDLKKQGSQIDSLRR